MTLESIPAVGPNDVGNLPSNAGWAATAIAIHSIRQMPTPMILRLELADFAQPIVVDFIHHAFDWDQPMSRFPLAPKGVRVETQPTFPGAPPVFALPGRHLDPLLWLIGYHAYDAARAPWLKADSRYRLTRWPNLSELQLSMDQVRMTAMLGNAFASADELAMAAGTLPAEAQRLVNAFSLLGILRESQEAIAPIANTTTEAVTASRGLFSRLREKLGL